MIIIIIMIIIMMKMGSAKVNIDKIITRESRREKKRGREEEGGKGKA